MFSQLKKHFSSLLSCCPILVLTFFTVCVNAQTPISPVIWNGNTGSASPAGFTTLPATTTPGAAAVNISTWQRNGPLGDGTGGSFNSNTWTVGGSLATAEAANTYISFTITNNAVTELRVTSFTILSQVSATGPETVQLAYSLGGANILFGAPVTTGHGATPVTWLVPGNACIGPSQTATFKLYGWGATGSAGTLRINNLTSITASYATVTPALTAAASNSSPVCTGTLLNFTGTATGGIAPDTYSWSGPVGFSSTLQDPSIASPLLAAAGTYTFTVTDAMTCTTAATTVVTVNPFASPIAGSDSVCVGATTALSDAGGGTWSSSNTGVATVATTTGVVTGVSPGTATITYVLSGGCVATAVITVNPLPAPITGTLSICAGSATTLSDGGDGTWSSSNISVASVATGSGFVTGVSGGTANITYMINAGACFVTAMETVNPLPPAIIGTPAVCIGAVTTLGGETGGSWSSSNTAAATVVTGTGAVTGITADTTTITYTSPANCITTTIVTVEPLPLPVTGTLTVCAGSTTTLSDGGGGRWSSSNTAIATVVTLTGVVTGVSAGTAVITYMISTGCFVTTEITVNPLPSIIAGTLTGCPGASTILSDGGGGTWSSGNTSIATVVSGTGSVWGVAAGTAAITYTLPTGCITSAVVTINPLPSPVSGTASVCAGLTTTLSDGGGGTWGSSNLGIATVITGSGEVSGVSGGTSVITYTLGTGCFATAIATVNPLPNTITGAAAVCAGATTILSDLGGGTWTSDNTAAATIGSTGIVTGVAPGFANITYTLPTGCTTTTSMLVFGPPPAITGTMFLCAGQATTLADITGGGTWSSSNSVATVGPSSGVVSGVAAGTSVITYTAAGTGCFATAVVTVNPLPATIMGASIVCTGTTVSLTDAGGGSWSSSNTVAATVGSTGIVTGIAPGTSTITYALSTGCAVATVVTVYPLPLAITGTTHICAGQATVWSDATSGGTWSGSAGTVATVGLSTGSITGAGAGTSVITYMLTTGCSATAVITVNPLPSSISGTLAVCAGAATSLSDGGGGTWSSGNTAVATIGTGTGAVTGVLPGTSVITYTLGTGCATAATITVNPLPAAISGTTVVCAGSVTNLSDAGGGTWSSSNMAAATVVTGTGVVTGASPGTSTITYTLATGCTTATIITVNPLPPVISGAGVVCAGSAIILSDAGGGTWSSGDMAVATVGAGSGAVTGVSGGTAIITYTLPAGCIATATITVNPLPLTISGATAICAGSATPLSDTGGGTWTSGNTAVATIVPVSGSVTGIAAGTSVITYTLATGCLTTTVITVNSFPSAITGPAAVCAGAAAVLTDPGGGSWSSSNTAIATVGPVTGMVSGITPGTTIITYALGSGCTTTETLTVNSLPSSITGVTSVCAGSATTLSDVGGGTWSSSNTSIATVITGSGAVTGVAADTVSITYTLATGCSVTTTVTVNPLPPAISGVLGVCLNSTTNLTDSPGGIWNSGTATVATVDGAGDVTGVSLGTSVITYTISTGCSTTAIITVNALPGIIGGTRSVCAGATTTLSDAGSGSWSSGNTAIATIGTGTGIITGVSAGTAIVTYTLGTGCSVTITVTVNPLPSAITGIASACIGLATDLADVSSGGAWSSSNAAIATVTTGTGIVTGVLAGAALISYTLPTGCRITAPVTIISLPAPISGTFHICAGSLTTLTDAGGGTWSSNNTAVATVGAAMGTVTGAAPGISTITYTVGTGCFVTVIVTVNAVPLPATGTLAVCAGSATLLTDITTGGAWASSATTIATVPSGTGNITGISAGTAIISYTLAGCGVAAVVTVNPLPSVISGAASVCAGSTTLLANTSAGGSWSSGTLAIATVDAGSGLVTGLSAGTAVITYSLSAGGSPSGCIAVKTVTVNPGPGPITGLRSICIGSVTTFTDASGGGSWSSSSVSIATISAGTGIVTGLSMGTSVISYSLGTGCIATAMLTVNSLPSAISGIRAVCAGSAITLSDAGGGAWSSAHATIATVGAATGVVTGVTAGTTAITYTLPAGCAASAIVTVNPSPLPIAGTFNICYGFTTTLGDATTGGAWSSAPSATAPVSPAGVVSGLSPGTAVISYTSSMGCAATQTITVNPLPLVITGASAVCVGSVTGFTDVGSGTWNSSNTAITTVGSLTGEVGGVSAGVASITYTLPTGCVTEKAITVLPIPSAITGAPSVCAGLTTTLTDTTTGGFWSSGNVAVGIIGSGAGVVTGRSSGTVIISYTMPSTGCSAISSIIVNPVSPISGDSVVCVGQEIILTDTTGAGTWGSSARPIAAIVTTSLTTGLITGIAAGTASIVYLLPAGCVATKVITVNPVPAAITGITHACTGLTAALSNAIPGGAWSSSDPFVATISTITGLVSAGAAGSAVISYTIAGCAVTALFTVNPLPAAITGASGICAGSTVTLIDTGGGTWGSSNTAIATIDPVAGLVTGITAGTSVITYTLATGCITAAAIIINPLPLPVTGVTTVCTGATTALSDAGFGGWSSSDAAIASVDPGTGIVAGISAGTATITYTLTTGCFTTVIVTVNALPAAITGASNICEGAAITLADAGGGTWVSGTSTVATVDAVSGIVTGVSPGTALITYSVGTGCSISAVITVNPLPAPITGVFHVCSGAAATLSDAATGGTWSSSNTAIATIDAAPGIYTGITGGTSIITYTTGCAVVTTITVIPMPSAILGSTSICSGSAHTLTDAAAGGTWSSSNTAIASVNAGTGAVTGVSTGAATIFYTTGGGCTVSAVVTVLPLPAIYTVTGGASYCAGGAGVHIGLNGSNAGVNYLLYLGITPTGTFAGTGAALDFGLQAAPGAYTVIAVNTSTGCTNIMSGSASVITTPTVVPSVSIAVSPADTVCSGASATFTPVPVNGGASPTYQWSVNGINVSTGNTYTFIPADGDVVSAILTSNATCPYPATATGITIMTVLSPKLPAVSIAADPGDTVCKGSVVTLSALPLYGGTTPAYVWTVNGISAGTGPGYAYMPQDGDVLSCTMTSNYICRLADTASAEVTMSVDSAMLPLVTITASPGTSIAIGESDTLTASVANGGPSPAYQWLLNGLPVAGATTNQYISSNFNYPKEDSVTCIVTSSGPCAMTSFQWVYMALHPAGVQTITQATGGISIVPNPNDGEFTIRGSLITANGADQEVSLEMTDMLGQVVYSNKITARKGKMDERLSTGTLANGMYLLSLRSVTENEVFHIVIEQ